MLTVAAALAAALVAFLVTRMVLVDRSRKLISGKDMEIARQKALLEASEKSLKDMKAANDEALKALRAEVTAETEKILKAREAELTKNNRTQLDEILNPLKESMLQMRKAMDDNAKEHVRSTTEMKEKFAQAVREMGQKTSDIGAKADELTTALTARPKVQGNWGENFLEDILSREGFEKGLHYDREVANTDQSRPDFRFHFRDGMEEKDLVVDSKVSLTAFVRYVNAGSEQEREAALKDHIDSINKHIEELARKDYAKKIEERKRFADYVLMFMPIDAAFRVAADRDQFLWKNAYDKGILIATEQTIMPFLKIMRLTWNKYQQDSNIHDVMKAAEELIDRVGSFYDDYKALGERINSVCSAYNKGINKLEEGGFSITTSARKIMKIGARRSKGKAFEVPDKTVELQQDNG